jgi:phosphoribosylpyrophosphate synthetase
MGPSEFAKATGRDKTAMFMGPKYLYRAKDHPEDIVHMEPIDKLVELPAIPDDPHALPSFEGIHIYYAYAVVPSSDFVEPGSASSPEANYTDYTELVDSVAHLVHPEEPRSEVERALADANRQVRWGMAYNPTIQAEAEEDVKALEKALETMDKVGVSTLADLSDSTQKAHDYINYKGKFLFHAAQSLAKKIKNPSPEEQETSDQFIRGAIQRLVQVHKQPFDIIAYPSSKKKAGSNFNIRIAKALQDVYPNAKPIEISKLSGNETEINWEAVYDRALTYHEEAKAGMHKRGRANLNMSPDRRAKVTDSSYFNVADLPQVDPEITLTPADEEWVEWWVAQLVAQLEVPVKMSGDKPIVAKTLQKLGSNKRYLKMFAKPTEDLRDKAILIVDDNVAYGGTMQILNDLVREQSPKEVLIFTPFYMGTVSTAY